MRTGGGWELRDEQTLVQVGPDEEITSLVDVETGRDTIGDAGPAGRLFLRPDLPNRWDAWDVDAHSLRAGEVLEGSVASPEDNEIVVVTPFGKSRAEQRFSLEDGALKATTCVDWHEQEKMLSMLWPLDLRANSVEAETQFGHVTRPLHKNTSWQAAQYLGVNHRWLHVGEPGFGVGIANSSTYGYGADRRIRPDGGSTTELAVHLH